MANAQSNVTVNISANTADLDAKVAKQEAAIKTLDGAINVLGGSVELAAGAMVGLGLANEETADKLTAAAAGAIAFADGAKRTIDGVKSLNEGLKSYGGIAGLASKAQKALNAAILANPYVAVAAALAVLTAAVYAYVVATDDAAEAAENLARRQAAAAAANTTYANTEVRILQARGEAQSVVLQAQLDAIKAREDEIATLLDSNIETAEANKLLEEGRKLYQDTKVVKEQLKKATADEAAAAIKAEEDKTAKLIAEDAKRKAEREKDYADRLAAEKKFLDDVFKAQEDLAAKQKAAAEKRKEDRQAINDYEHELLMDEFNTSIEFLKKGNEERQKGNEQATKDNEERIANEKEAISASLSAFSNLAQSLADVQDDTSKEGFEAGKKYKIAQVVTSALQSAFEAYAGAQKFNAVVPGLGTTIGIASVAAIALASKKAIQDIQSAQFGGTSSPNISAPASSGGGFAQPNISAQFGQGGFLAPGTSGAIPSLAPAEPIQAYVLASDVTTGLQAYGQISRRRRFG